MFKKKITWIDISIALVIIISIVGLGSKFAKANVATPLSNTRDKILITFYIEELPDFVVDAINIGDPVRESIQNSSFGKVIDISTSDSVGWKLAADGNLVTSSKEGHYSLSITMEADGLINNGGVSIDKSVYYVGQTLTLYAGNSILRDGRISEINIANQQ